MSRWKPNTKERLERAASELFAERDFDDITVAEIAQRAGLTERTFFRYFTDKREVLFSGRQALEDAFSDTIASATDSATPLQMVTEALMNVGEFMETRREFARKRQSIITANPELQERELLKMEHLSRVIAEALIKKGVTEPTASLSANMTTAIFRIAFAEWVVTQDTMSLNEHMKNLLDQFSTIAASGQ
jgi:AcrR family transcriptional regulator